MKPVEPELQEWESLPESRQTELLEAFGHYQDGLPATCSMDMKVERFRQWLSERGVRYRQPR